MSLFRFRPLASNAIRPIVPRFYTTDWRTHTASKWNSDQEIERAREWVEKFKVTDIPKKSCTITYSASSGPGGQNVNKLATKATLHLDLNRNAGFLPDFVLQKVRENSRHLTKDEAIVIQADGSRKRSENQDEVYQRLHKILVESVSVDVPGVTSTEKKKRVQQLKKQDEQLRRKLKTIQKAKKDSRRSRPSDD